MTDDTQQADRHKLRELAERRIVLSVRGMQDVQVRRDIAYKSTTDEDSAIDVYCPPSSVSAMPAVIFVSGYRDKDGLDLIGLRLKEWGGYVSWGQLVAVSGLVGITYSSSEPSVDAQKVLRFVRDHSAEFSIDPARIGIWAASGNGPTALSMLMGGSTGLRFAVLSNTYMLDLDGDTMVSDMAAQFKFSAPNTGKTVRGLDPQVPLFVVRSGRDDVPGLNQTIDRFTRHAIETNLPLQLVNLPDAPHSYDTLHDTKRSRETIQQIVNFMLASNETPSRST